ncbi:MAG: hypothetical protein QOF91_839 [Alphaproteobacteria bacterium]|nr:hypothetical protein [Alphaproteobacteria bacterium]
MVWAVRGSVVVGTDVRWRAGAWLCALALFLMADFAVAEETDLAIAEWFETYSLSIPNHWTIVVCHGFSCAFRTQVALNEIDRARLARMVTAATPEGERRGLARAVAWFDRRAGGAAGTIHAKGRAAGAAGDPSQFDCIDRTLNTMSLVTVLQQWGMLHHHRLAGPASRHIVAPHTSAVVAERIGGRKWVIDPWTHNFGELPDVMPLQTWVDLD